MHWLDLNIMVDCLTSFAILRRLLCLLERVRELFVDNMIVDRSQVEYFALMRLKKLIVDAVLT